MSEEPLKDSKPLVQRNKKGQLLPGSILNPDGYTKGLNNFKTDFDEAVDEIAKLNNITQSEARKILLKKAYLEAKEGNFNFYKDIVDRYYGKAPDTLKIQPITEDSLLHPEDEELRKEFKARLKENINKRAKNG